MTTYTGMNPDGPGVRNDIDHLRTSVRKIITTPIGTRVMRRNFGSLVPDLIDEPENEVTRMQLMSAIVIAITQWEPRIALNSIDVIFTDGTAIARMTGKIVATMESISTNIDLRGK